MVIELLIIEDSVHVEIEVVVNHQEVVLLLKLLHEDRGLLEEHP